MRRIGRMVAAGGATLAVLAAMLGPGPVGDETRGGPAPAEAPSAADSGSKDTAKAADPRAPRTKIQKTDAQWRKLLGSSSYWVMRQKGTEPAFSGRYAQGHFQGLFLCAACEAPLFSSRAKFDSGTGWPSFWQPVNREALAQAWDYHGAEPRIEVMCWRCDGHLGHVFNDGPAPTGLRYCINSVAIKLQPAESAAPKDKAKDKATTEPEANAASEANAEAVGNERRGRTPAETPSRSSRFRRRAPEPSTRVSSSTPR